MTSSNKFSGVLGGEEYDLLKLVLDHHDDFQAAVGQQLQEFTRTVSDERILVAEIGVGTGLTTRELLAVDERITILGIDNEPKMVEAARPHFLKRVQFVVDDALTTLRQLDDESFDVVASCFCIHNMPSDWRRDLFQEIGRVVRTGGIVINGDKIAVDNSETHETMLRKQLANCRKFDEIGRPDIREEWVNHYLADDLIRFTEAEQERLLRTNGFVRVRQPYRADLETVFVGHKR